MRVKKREDVKGKNGKSRGMEQDKRYAREERAAMKKGRKEIQRGDTEEMKESKKGRKVIGKKKRRTGR